jgi:CxxC-x17-CxxC domain-containing protein
MSDSDFEETRHASIQHVEIANEFEDASIICIDCAEAFVWTSGEQAFFHDKNLLNPPKRCKDCKKAKNRRLEAIEIARVTGKRHRIEVKAECARCEATTTVPFYPCQGRPVYCRACYIEMNAEIANGANGNL